MKNPFRRRYVFISRKTGLTMVKFWTKRSTLQFRQIWEGTDALIHLVYK